jgi:hypothetical protein
MLSFEIPLEFGNTLGLKLWVDRRKGFTPIRLVQRFNERVELESSSEWAEIGGVWVPMRLTGQSHSPYIPEGEETKKENIRYRTIDFHMSFVWESVNDPIGSSEYDFREFDLPKETRVFDEKGKLIHIYGFELPERPVPSEREPNGRGLFLAISLLVILVMAVAYFLKRFLGTR